MRILFGMKHGEEKIVIEQFKFLRQGRLQFYDNGFVENISGIEETEGTYTATPQQFCPTGGFTAIYLSNNSFDAQMGFNGISKFIASEDGQGFDLSASLFWKNSIRKSNMLSYNYYMATL